MRLLAITLTPLAALALTACGGEAEREAAPPKPLEAAPAAEAKPNVAPEPEQVEPAETEAADPSAETLANTIPARFHGVWDYEVSACSEASDSRMEISAGEVLFHESIGSVTGVAAEGDDVNVTMAMEGEGDTWTQATRLSLVGEGDALRLHTSQGDKPKQTDEYPSVKCPG